MKIVSDLRRGSRKGFTLIELLIVIAIIAILAGTVLPYVQTYIQDSKISKAKSDLEEIGKAIAIYESIEKPYTASDVFQLTGRYLTKSPIDPWGRPFLVATHAGIVYSSGPDKNPATQEDNITYMYQPPLALVRAKWADVNQNGKVDGDSPADHLVLSFSRIINDQAVGADVKDPHNFILSSLSDTDLESAFDWNSVATMADGRGLVIPIAADARGIFTIGSDTVTVSEQNSIFDTSLFQQNRCLSRQTVIIQPQ